MEESQVNTKMIQFENACNIIKRNVIESNKSEFLEVEDSHQRLLFKSYSSTLDIPNNNQSAMDGIVVLKNEKKKNLKIVGESKAGDLNGKNFKQGECCFVYTGGPINGNNKKIIPKENFVVNGKFVIIKSFPKDSFVRKKASDITKNKIYLKYKSLINLRSLALAKSMKIKKLKVFKKPKVFIICTGDEIIKTPQKNNLVESTNDMFIKFIVKKFGGEIKKICYSNDNESDFIKKYKSIEDFDILITSGGISKGKYDIVKSSLKKIGLKVLFDRIAIKPGKPTTFGKLAKKKYFLGLPGNPVSCFITMLNFFPVFLSSFYGVEFNPLLKKKYISKNTLYKNNNLTQFHRVSIKGDYFKVFKNQDSSLLNTLSLSDGILIREPHDSIIRANQRKDIILFNNIVSESI